MEDPKWTPISKPWRIPDRLIVVGPRSPARNPSAGSVSHSPAKRWREPLRNDGKRGLWLNILDRLELGFAC